MGTMEYTPNEIEKIQQLRSLVSAELTTKFQNEDAFLITWLKARNMDVARAEEMLRKSLKWRKDNQVDGILLRESIPSKYNNFFPCAYLGMDPVTGCPVFLFLIGRIDLRKIIEDDGIEMAVRYNILYMEAVQKILKECSKKFGRPVTSYIELVDLEGYTLRQIKTKQSRNGTTQVQQMFDDNYPEVIKSVVVINAPKVFSFLFKLIKPMVSKATLDKVEILGPNVEEWKAAVAKKFPMELLPPHWGGSRVGNDEYCSNSDIWMYGPLGPKYFSKSKLETDCDPQEVDMSV